MRRTIILAGTGTDLGKTHLADALLRVPPDLATNVVVWKPYESGVSAAEPSDSERLGAAVASRSSIGIGQTRLEPPLARFQAPLAPPLAATLAGDTLDDATFLGALAQLESASEVLLIELAGGLFAPQTDGLLGVDVALAAHEALVVVVAPNRLGVLHDVTATFRAAAAEGCHVKHLVLVDVPLPDASAPHNLSMLRRALPASVELHAVDRAPASELASAPVVIALARQLFDPK